MGAGLRKVFLAVRPAVRSGRAGRREAGDQRWEEEYAAAAGHAEPRPLNLDPGYLTLGKLVLASTKDFAHRIYLGRGIYAEMTLFYRHHRWQAPRVDVRRLPPRGLPAVLQRVPRVLCTCD